MEDDDSMEIEAEGWLGLYTVHTKSDKKPIVIDVTVEGETIPMEQDTGSAVSIISEAKYQKWLSHVPLEDTSLKLHTYTGESVTPIGVLYGRVQYGSQEATLPLYVTKGTRPTLLGREWLQSIQLNWPLMHHETQQGLQDVLNRHTAVFLVNLAN